MQEYQGAEGSAFPLARAEIHVAVADGTFVIHEGPPPLNRLPGNHPEFDAAWNLMLSKKFTAASTQFAALTYRLFPDSRAHRAADAAYFCAVKSGMKVERLDAFCHALVANRFAHTVGLLHTASKAIYAGDADAFFDISQRLSSFDPEMWGPWSRGLTTRPIKIESAQIASKIPAMAGGRSIRSSAAFVILMAADRKYFNSFAELSVSSYRAVGGTERMVIYVINPDQDALRKAEELQAVYSDVDVRQITVDAAVGKAFFASFRYLVAADLILETGCDVHVFDIDVGFKKTLSEHYADIQFDRDKVGLRISPVFTLPWQKITVNSVYFPAVPQGLAFARHMARFLEAQFFNFGTRDIWWVDQNAALSAFLSADANHIQNMDVRGLLSLPELFEDRTAGLRQNLQKA